MEKLLKKSLVLLIVAIATMMLLQFPVKASEEDTNIVEENPNIVTDGDTNFINNRLIVEFINELSKEEMESYITSIGAKLIYVISSYEGIIEINTTFNTISEIENYATQFEEEHADMIGYAVPQTVD